MVWFGLVGANQFVYIDIHTQSLLAAHYAARRATLRQVPHFWPLVLRSTPELADFLTYEDDALLDHLVDVHVEYPGLSSKATAHDFSVTLEFAENPYLLTTTLVKHFKLEKSARQDDTGATRAVEKYTSEPVALAWADKKHNLTRRAKTGEGNHSFFNWFSFTGAGPGDYAGGESVALTMAEVVFPHAIKLFLDGVREMDDLEDEYDLSEDDDEDEEDEGLKRALETTESPRKKQK